MFKTLVVSMTVAAAIATTAAAHGVQQQPSLLGALVQVGNHGSIANVVATVASPRSVADVNANLLGGAVKANVDVGQTGRHTDTLLGISATVLDGGVGNRQNHW